MMNQLFLLAGVFLGLDGARLALNLTAPVEFAVALVRNVIELVSVVPSAAAQQVAAISTWNDEQPQVRLQILMFCWMLPAEVRLHLRPTTPNDPVAGSASQ